MTEHEVRHSDPEKGKILAVVSLVLLGGDQDLLQPMLSVTLGMPHSVPIFSRIRITRARDSISGHRDLDCLLWVLCGQQGKDTSPFLFCEWVLLE